MGRRFLGVCAVATVLLTGAFYGGFLLRMFLVVLVFALAVRGGYVLLRRGRARLWSPWVLAIAAVVAFMNLYGARHRRLERSANAAIREGLVSDRTELTPQIRCIALYLSAWERQPPAERVWPTKADDRAFADVVCSRAARERALWDDGWVEPKAAARLEAETSRALAP